MSYRKSQAQTAEAPLWRLAEAVSWRGRSKSNTCSVTKTTMADYLAIHPRTVQRWLALEGTSFYRLLEQVRIERATTTLANSDISITKLALELGYSDTAHFSRAFRRCNGVSPRAYRTLCATDKSPQT